MGDELDLPVALRRARRTLAKIKAAEQTSSVFQTRPAQDTLVVSTPKPKKRRVNQEADQPSATGLTPMMHRARLSSKRRIQRTGITEEKDAVAPRRKQRARDIKDQIERLKEELARKDEEIERLQDETLVLDTDRIFDLEQQVAALTTELARHARGQQGHISRVGHRATSTARNASDGGSMLLDIENEVEELGEVARAEIITSTPTRRIRASFPTPPSTSPSAPEMQTPCRRLTRSRCDVGVQSSLPDPEKQRVETELASLQFEMGKLTAELESYSALASRLSEKLSPFSVNTKCEAQLSSTSHSEIETRLTGVLQTLSDQAAVIAELGASLKSLGFKGSDAFEVVDSLRTHFRTARLELEYLTPGEIALPLAGAGAEVLDLFLSRLRKLARKKREADDCIEEYHAIEVSLRQQLSARVDAMDSLVNQLRESERSSRDKDTRIAELEVRLDGLKSAVSNYTRGISEIDPLTERIETELAAADSQVGGKRQTTEGQTSFTDLETKLASALELITALQSQLTSLSATHAEALQAHKIQVSNLVKSQGACLAQRDARMVELRAEVHRFNAALLEAQSAVRKLWVENARLVAANDRLVEENREALRQVEEGRRKAKENVKGSDSRKIGRLLVGERTRLGSWGKRKRYDSGLGFWMKRTMMRFHEYINTGKL
ncbi:uncharacterized protein B0T15DRAFT_434651 [Chaetomium strumarium]|uniref:Uncharacterized protein n=1 Tax=Chaetomium strumarium TaxID=1170767 RepID=A0AAJ0GT18_9PEZI|nr:hypothetical protein B0T15DRAFT_434651 [Chaetomium strumarium]